MANYDTAEKPQSPDTEFFPLEDKGGSLNVGYSYANSLPDTSEAALKTGYSDCERITGDTKSDKGYA